MDMYSISIVTPTFNSMRTFIQYFDSILNQTYPHDRIEIVIADGGSTDGTIEQVKKYLLNCDIDIKLLDNPLRTAEAGKAVGARKSTKQIICFLDSDNIIPDSAWLARMTEPLYRHDIVASEPIEYIWREADTTINRYCALIGMNDPLCIFTGNYDRRCLITNKWTNIKHDEIDKGNFLSISFNHGMIPTIGANGFLIKRNYLLDNFSGDYLFDIDILWELFDKTPELRIAKVKTGIVHLFCQDTKQFYRKQNRRIKDYLYFNDVNDRKYPWKSISKWKIVLFGLSTVSVFPLLFQLIIGFTRKRDLKAWLFHIPACWITLWVYGVGTIKGIVHKEAAKRDNWKQ